MTELPSRTDRLAALATEVIGGPVGRYARVGKRVWVPAAAVLSAVASVVVALGVLQKNHCVREGWATPGSLWRMCYSDLPAAANGSAPATPFSAGGPGASQPVLTAVVTWIAQRIVPGSSTGLGRQQWYFAIAAVIIVVLVALTVTAVAWMLPSTPWRAALVALSPVLVTSALVSYDMLGVALMALGLAAWVRRYPWAAGALLGAATMARSFPVVVLAAAAMVGWQVARRDDVRKMLVAAGAVGVFCLALGYALGGDPLAAYGIWNRQQGTYGSVWIVAQICGLDLSAGTLTVIAALGWGAALTVGLRLTGRERPPSVVAVATVMLVIVMLTGKSNPVQAALWLLPLLAASALPWREYLAWAGVELIAYAGTWLYVGSSFDAQKSLPGPAYVLVATLRLMALAVVAWRVLDLDTRTPKPAAPGAVRVQEPTASGPSHS
jgi:Glycosyltransferase family 87